MNTRIAALAVSAVLGLSVAPQAGAGDAAELLPNLRPRAPKDVRVATEGNRRWLYFSTEIANAGRGPLELQPKAESCDGDAARRPTFQHIFLDENSNGEFDRGSESEPGDGFTERPAGCSVFHPGHDHWHFEDFARYELFKLRSDGTLRRRAARTADKVSFCMTDTKTLGVAPPGTPSDPYYKPLGQGCGELDESGISIGWYDLYAHDLPEHSQALPITMLKPGRFCLSYSIDPAHRLNEIKDTDNVRMMRLWIGNNAVRRFPRKPCPSP